MARFDREAQLLAALNHPNIAAIYGVEDRALVMELVQGATLGERIAKGAIRLEEAEPLIEQIVDALEYAHQKGVVHRDLKPANIKITPEGRVKVLDFGLAKALADQNAHTDPISSSTLHMGATAAGVIIGTVAYMAPEQARGQSVDKRADIWSFGVVVYEMLTGRRPFEGGTTSDTLAAVLKTEPDWNGVPVKARALLRSCLSKEPTRRLRDIGDAPLLLRDAPEGSPPAKANRRWWMAFAAITLAACGVLAGWALSHLLKARTEEQPFSLQINPPESGQFIFGTRTGGRAGSVPGWPNCSVYCPGQWEERALGPAARWHSRALVVSV
jgi:serine/threonine-protein kinase